MNVEVHYKNGENAPATACGITDTWVIWSKQHDDITCVKCNDMLDMRAP